MRALLSSLRTDSSVYTCINSILYSVPVLTLILPAVFNSLSTLYAEWSVQAAVSFPK